MQQQELNKISFHEVSGKVEFTKEQEVLTMIDIIQVRNGTQVIFGEYNPNTRNLTFNNNFNGEEIPGDMSEVRHDAITLWLGVLVALSQGFLLLLSATTSVYIVHWRDAPEVKSSSMRVSVHWRDAPEVKSSSMRVSVHWRDAPEVKSSSMCVSVH